jgi:mitogen-activated protein kinase kinase 1 interacting protein 1
LLFNSNQAGKLALGKNQSITAFYQDHVIVHINHLPIVVTLVGTADANVGLMLSCAPKVKSSLESTRTQLLGDD